MAGADHLVIVDDDIDWLINLEKPVPDPDWRSHLLPPAEGLSDRHGKYVLEEIPPGGRLGGRLHLYARANLRPNVVGDWSTGLIYTDYADRSYPVVRCNGPHESDHTNTIERTVIVTQPHVHLLTERYQRLRRPKLSGYATPTDAYSTLEEAVEHLASLVNLHPVDRLFL